MLDHVFQFGVQKGEELFTTGTPSVQMSSLQKGSDVGDTPESPPPTTSLIFHSLRSIANFMDKL